MDTAGRVEREGEMYGKSNLETYNTICKIAKKKDSGERVWRSTCLVAVGCIVEGVLYLSSFTY